MKRIALLTAALLFATAGSAAQIDRVSVYATGGKSFTTWHGQADVQMLNIELTRELSPRSDFAVVIAPANIWQPRSWFGDQYHDGNEPARAISTSILMRRRFFVDSTRFEVDLEGGTGPFYADIAVPASTSRFNFVTQVGTSVVIAPHSRLPIVVGYRFQHISNGGYSPRNPGLNVSALLLGFRMRAR